MVKKDEELLNKINALFLERLLVVNEYYESNLESLVNDNIVLSVEQIQQWSHQILNGLIYLQEKQLYARNLSLKNIRLTESVRKFQMNIFLRTFSI
jgi:serine/threonine protein kinase